MIEILGRLREMASPAALGCACLAAIAAYLLVRHPGDRLIGRSRAAARDRAAVRGRAAGPWPGRCDAQRRAGCCSAGAAAGAVSAPAVVEVGPWSGLAALARRVGDAVLGAAALGWLAPRSAARRRQQLILQAPQALELMAVLPGCRHAGTPGVPGDRRRLRRAGRR